MLQPTPEVAGGNKAHGSREGMYVLKETSAAYEHPVREPVEADSHQPSNTVAPGPCTWQHLKQWDMSAPTLLSLMAVKDDHLLSVYSWTKKPAVYIVTNQATALRMPIQPEVVSSTFNPALGKWR